MIRFLRIDFRIKRKFQGYHKVFYTPGQKSIHETFFPKFSKKRNNSKKTGHHKNLRKYIKFIVLFSIAVFIFWFFGRNLDWQEVTQSLKQANPVYIGAAVLIICLGYLLRAKRWQVLLEPITESSLKELFATTTVGFAAVFLIGRAGEIVRPMWLPMRDERVRPSAALVTLGVERIFDFAAIICFFAINLLWFDVPAGRENEFAYVKLVGFLMLGGVFLGFIALYVYYRYADRIIVRADKWTDKEIVPRRVKRVLMSILRQLAKSLVILRSGRGIAKVSFWTIMLWMSVAVPTWLVLIAFGLPLSFSDALFVMGWAAFGSVVPTPGGAAGAFHAATAGGLIFLNTSQELAAATSILMHLVYFAPAVVFGLFYFLHGDISVAKFRNLLSSEHTVEEIEEENKRLAVSG